MQKCVAERGGPLRHEERLRKLDFAKTVAEQRQLQLQQASKLHGFIWAHMGSMARLYNISVKPSRKSLS